MTADPLGWQDAAALFSILLAVALSWRALRGLVARHRRAKWARRARAISDLLALSPNEFETITAAAFEARGWRAQIIGREGRPDGGLDLLLFRRGRRFVVQCKRYAGKVGAPVVRETIGVMIHHNAQGAFVVGLSGFTRAAQEWAKGKPLRLIDGKQLLKILGKSG